MTPPDARRNLGRVSTSQWLGHRCCLFVKLQLAPRGLLNIVPIQIVGLSSYADKEWERPTSLVRRSAPGVLSLLALPTAGAVVWILTHRPSALSAPLHDGSPPRARFQTTQMPSPAPAASFHERRHVGEIVTSKSARLSHPRDRFIYSKPFRRAKKHRGRALAMTFCHKSAFASPP